MTIIERSRLRALSTEQVLNIASTQIAAGNIGKWPRIRRLWTDKNMDRTACVGNGLHGDCREQVAFNDGPQTTAE